MLKHQDEYLNNFSEADHNFKTTQHELRSPRFYLGGWHLECSKLLEYENTQVQDEDDNCLDLLSEVER